MLNELGIFILVGVRMTHRIDDRTIELLLELHRDGISSIDAGRVAGVSYQTALNVWRRNGLEPNFHKARVPYSKIRLIKEFTERGHSIKDATLEFQLSEATVRRNLKTYAQAEPLLHEFGIQLKKLIRSKADAAPSLRTVPLPYDQRARWKGRNNIFPEALYEKNALNNFNERKLEGRGRAGDQRKELLRGNSSIPFAKETKRNIIPILNVPVHLGPNIIDISRFFPGRTYGSQSRRIKAR